MSLPNMEPARIDGARHVTEELSEERCWELLASQDTGRFGFVYKNRVMILPVSYLIHNKAIYFRTSATGTIGDAVPRRSHRSKSMRQDPIAAKDGQSWSADRLRMWRSRIY